MKMQRLVCSPYGSTTNGEEYCRFEVSGVTAVFLRYFNPIGSHPSIEIGDYRWSAQNFSAIYNEQQWN
jgi:UDP-glucose 4-epimerase